MAVNKKMFPLVFSLTVAFVMSLFMSGVMVLVTVGFKPIFFFAWLRSFAISFAVALPLSIFVIPVINRALMKAFGIQSPVAK